MHEYHLWEDLKLPDGKILIPGVVAHMEGVNRLVRWLVITGFRPRR
jgi:hypothetical protein